MSSNSLMYVAGIRTRRAADRRLVDDDELIELVDAFDAIVFAGLAFAAHQVAEQRLGDDVVHERAFAGTARARDAHKRAERNFDIDVFKVVVPAPMTALASRAVSAPFLELVLGGRPSPCDGAAPGSLPYAVTTSIDAASVFQFFAYPKERPGNTARFLRNFLSGPAAHDFAAPHTGAGAKIDQVVGRPHRVFIVFDDDDRVAQVAKLGTAYRAVADCRAGEGRSRVRRECTAHRRGRSRFARRGECVAIRRRKA